MDAIIICKRCLLPAALPCRVFSPTSTTALLKALWPISGRKLDSKLAKTIPLILTESEQEWHWQKQLYEEEVGTVTRNSAAPFCLAHLGLKANLCPCLLDRAASVVADSLQSSVCLPPAEAAAGVVAPTHLEFAQAAAEILCGMAVRTVWARGQSLNCPFLPGDVVKYSSTGEFPPLSIFMLKIRVKYMQANSFAINNCHETKYIADYSNLEHI